MEGNRCPWFQKSKRNSANTLHILTKIGNEKFEFLFTPLNENKKDFSAILNEIHKYVKNQTDYRTAQSVE